MGFGILFLGYVLTFGSAFYSVYFFGDIIGSIIMIVSLALLSQYCRKFRFAAASAGGLCALYAAAAAMRMMGYGTPAESETWLIGEQIYQWIQYLIPAAALLFYCFLLIATANLSKSVELPHISKRCYIYMVVFAVYFVIWLLFSLMGGRIYEASVRVYNVTASGLYLFQAVWFIMMIFNILSCLKWIAPAEQVEAEERGESADDGVLSKIGEKLDALQTKAHTKKEDRESLELQAEDPASYTVTEIKKRKASENPEEAEIPENEEGSEE